MLMSHESILTSSASHDLGMLGLHLSTTTTFRISSKVGSGATCSWYGCLYSSTEGWSEKGGLVLEEGSVLEEELVLEEGLVN